MMNNTKTSHCRHAFWIETEQEAAVAVRIDIAVLVHTLPMKHAAPEEFKLVQPWIVANLIILSDTASLSLGDRLFVLLRCLHKALTFPLYRVGTTAHFELCRIAVTTAAIS
jgi:hypothetical protein